MDKKKSRLFLGMCIVMAVAVFAMLEVFFVFFDNSWFLGDDDSKAQEELSDDVTSSKFDDDGYMYIDGTRRAGDVMFSNVRIRVIKSGKCEFLADVENVTEKYLNTQSVEVSVVDDSGEVDEVFAGLLTELAPYESSTFKTQVLSDITDALSVEFAVTEL